MTRKLTFIGHVGAEALMAEYGKVRQARDAHEAWFRETIRRNPDAPTEARLLQKLRAICVAVPR